MPARGNALKGAPRELSPVSKLCTVVVTYRPDAALLSQCLRAAASQSDALLIVENDSSVRTPFQSGPAGDSLEEMVQNDGHCDVRVIPSDVNLGLSKAYNLAVKSTLDLGVDAYLFLDQDSVLTPGCVDELKSQFLRRQTSFQVGAIQARNAEERTLNIDDFLVGYYNRRGLFEDDSAREQLFLTNSGMFIPSRTFKQVGLFDERLFVDAIDHEYSMRLLRHGLSILLAKNAIVRHRRGVENHHATPGPAARFRSYSPGRWQTMSRDTFLATSTYARQYPVLSGLICSGFMINSLTSALFGNHGWGTLRASGLGLVSALRELNRRNPVSERPTS